MAAIDPAFPSAATASRLGALLTGSDGGWSLTTIGLSNCWISDAGLQALARALPKAPALTALDVSLNEMHGLGQEAAAQLSAAWAACGRAEKGLYGL